VTGQFRRASWRAAVRLSSLALLWTVVAGATPAPLQPPPPDLTGLVPFVRAPLDKPPVTIPMPPVPTVSVDLPDLPPAPMIMPRGDRPLAPLEKPSGAPCFFSTFEYQWVACGKLRLIEGRFGDAERAFKQALQSEPDIYLAEARYWLGETYERLGHLREAYQSFERAARDQKNPQFKPWALHSAGWAAVRLGEFDSARVAFSQLFAQPRDPAVDLWGRHGLAMALYATGRFDVALKEWVDLSRRQLPPVLARDVAFWLGEALARTAHYSQAAAQLARFIQGGPHPLLETARLRAAWWAYLGGQERESLAAFQAYMKEAPASEPAGVRTGGGPSRGPERDWGETGLALTSVATGDIETARIIAMGLTRRKSPLAVPVLVRLARGALEAGQLAEVRTLVQELLPTSLPPEVRAWVLLVQGEVSYLEDRRARASGDRSDDQSLDRRDEARTQFDLARKASPDTATGAYATLRLAQVNFDLREFAQALTEATAVVGTRSSRELRVAALLLQGEAAYHAGDYAPSAAAFAQALADLPPNQPETPSVRLALAWTELRQRLVEARKRFVDFARSYPADPHAADALLLASEEALEAFERQGRSEDLLQAEQLLDQVIKGYPEHSRTGFARLNRAILRLREGDPAAAESQLRALIVPGLFPSLPGRAHAALGVALLERGRAREAAKEFGLALNEGEGALASLGLGTAALAEGRGDDAERQLRQARADGIAGVRAAAEHGLVAAAFARGRVREFKPLAIARLKAAPRDRSAPALLYVLTGIGVEEKDWTGALERARELAATFPEDPRADDALARVALAAARVPAVDVVTQAYEQLVKRYPRSPFVSDIRLSLAETQLEAGRLQEAAKLLEEAVAPGAEAPPTRVWFLLARAREGSGDRRGALEAYSRAAQQSKESDWSKDTVFTHARLLHEEKRWAEARSVLERLLRSSDPDTVVEAAHGIGETYQGQGDHLAAAEYFMTSAYLLPQSTVGRRALVAAGRSFAALKQPGAAKIVYEKLLAQSGVPPDIAEAARQGRDSLPR
jgi:tetratricopeptide (TPR) repeat protein